MTREFSVIVGIDAGKARRGAREFKAASNTVVQGSTRMSRGLRGANNRAVALITTIGRLRGVATLAFSGFLGVGGLVAVTRTLSQFQTEISRVNALLGERGTTGVMNVLTERARDLGATTIFTATQAAEGIRFLTLAGFEAAESYIAVESALNLAAAGSLDLATSADLLSNIMSAFAVNAQDAADVADGLAIVAARSNTSIRQLGEAMKFVGPVAGNLGIEVKDASAALGILGNSGLQASLAGTSLRRVISGLLNPSREAEEVFAGLNVTQEELLTLLKGPDGIVNLVDRLAEAGIGATEAFTLFGVRGAPGFLTLIEQRAELRDLTEATREFGGEVERQAKILADNLGGDARAAISAVQEGILSLGDAGLNNFLRDAVQGFTGFVRALAGVETANDDLTESLSAGIRVGEFVKDNINLIKNAALGLAIVLTRNLIPSLVRTLILLGNNATKAFLGFAASVRSGSVATTLLTGSLKLLRGALIATGIGALVVAIGYLADWAINALSAEEATASFTEEIERMGVEAQEAKVRFDAFQGSLRNDQFEEQRQRVVKSYEAIQTAKANIDELIAAQSRLKTQTAETDEVQEQNSRTIIALAGAGNQYQQNLGLQLSLMEQTETAQDALNRTQETAEQSLIGLRDQLSAAEKNYQDQIEALRLMALVNKGFAESTEEAARKLKDLEEASDAVSNSLKELTGFTEDAKNALDDAIGKYDKNAIAITALKDQIALLKQAAGLTDEQLAILGTTQEQVARAAANAQEALEKLEEQGLTPAARAAKENAEAAQEIVDRLNPLAVLTRTYASEVRILVLEWIASKGAAFDLGEEIKKLQGEFEKNRAELMKNCEETDKFTECQSEAAKAMQTIWDQALRNIQDTFADAFKGAFDSFDEFRDRLLDAIKNMIAEILSAKLLGGLKDALGDIFGIATGGSGGGGGLLAGVKKFFADGGTLKEVFSKGFDKIIAVGKKAIGVLANFGKGFLSAFNIGGGGAGLAGTVGGLAGGAAIGLGAGNVVDDLLGSRGRQGTTNALSGVGGAIGFAIGGPLGAIVGGAIGGFASSLFGGAKKLESAVVEFNASSEGFTAVLEKVTSKQRSFFRGRKFSTSSEDLDVTQFSDALAGILGGIVDIATGLGVDAESALENFVFNREINIKGKSEEQITALLEDVFNDAVLDAIETFIENAEGLSERLVKTVNLFKGNSEEFLRAFSAAATIDTALLIDPVQAVTDEIASQNVTLTRTYDDLLASYRDLVANFDGSLPALEELAVATQIVVAAQLELTAALISAGEAISATFQDSAQTIRESLLTEEELYNLRRTQIDDLVAQANSTTDPAELRALADEINSLTNDAFGLLTEDQQSALGQEFIDFFGELDELFGGQIQTGLDNISEDNSAIDQEVADSLTSAAQAIIDANNDARDFWRDWRDWIREDRGRGGLGGNTRLRELVP